MRTISKSMNTLFIAPKISAQQNCSLPFISTTNGVLRVLIQPEKNQQLLWTLLY